MMRRAAAFPGEPAIEGRTKIAQALSGIMGVPVSPWAVDRLSERRRSPLPLHGYLGRRWVFLSEVQTWWEETDEYRKHVGRRRFGG